MRTLAVCLLLALPTSVAASERPHTTTHITKRTTHKKHACQLGCRIHRERVAVRWLRSKVIKRSLTAYLPHPRPAHLSWKHRQVRHELAWWKRTDQLTKKLARVPLSQSHPALVAVAVHRPLRVEPDLVDVADLGALERRRLLGRPADGRRLPAHLRRRHDRAATTAASPTRGRPRSRSSWPTAPGRRAATSPGRTRRGCAGCAESARRACKRLHGPSHILAAWPGTLQTSPSRQESARRPSAACSTASPASPTPRARPC